jgi:enoyl-CoA hydratase/carnithine racemase
MSSVTLDIQEKIAFISFNRPDSLNALNARNDYSSKGYLYEIGK